MKAREIMTTRVLTIRQDQSLIDAARLMLKRRVSGLPVVDAAGELVGIVTEGDLLRRTETGTERHRARWLEFLIGPGKAAEEFTRTHGRKVSEVMTPSPFALNEEAPLDEIVAQMERHRIKRLPIVRDRKVVGIVSRANLVQALIDNANYETAGIGSDREIRQNVLAEMEKQSWAPTALVGVHVDKGVVTFTGTILDERDRAALKVLAENLPGVRMVHDEMIWVEPFSGVTICSEDLEVTPVKKEKEAAS